MAQKPSIPKGTRDFGPLEMTRRNYIFSMISSVFDRYGYSQIETPATENLSTLLGKYGDEGDKLLFKILNSGEAFRGIEIAPGVGESESNAIAMKVCEKGLRYDLTVPFARYVVQHRNEITFPFKRYQIQPVWRADRPQKGRYREFYQCDVDVIGSKSLLNELELLQIVNDVFKRLKINVLIKINNRKILSGLAEISGMPEKLTDITVAIDKIDKIGLRAVKEELSSKGLSDESIACIEPVLTLSGSFSDKMYSMKRLISSSEVGMKGLEEIEELFSLARMAGLSDNLDFDLSLARGLNYYTGAIFEVKALDFAIGSICGGGRYDDLTGIFGLPDTSGVGISFGADRIYDVLLGTDGFPDDAEKGVEYLFANMGGAELPYLLPIVSRLRESGFSVAIFPDAVKLRKQFEYADRNHVHYVVIAGEDEVAANEVTVKDMRTGEQKRVGVDSLFCEEKFG